MFISAKIPTTSGATKHGNAVGAPDEESVAERSICDGRALAAGQTVRASLAPTLHSSDSYPSGRNLGEQMQ